MINSKNIDDLHPTLKRGAIELVNRLKGHGYTLGISATYRDFEYQNYLYEQGRTRPGNIVTNARGGESLHNYRLAFDIYQNVKDDLYNENFLRLSGNIWEQMGGKWGGRWDLFPDKPHMEFAGLLSLRELQNGKMLDKNMKMKWENEEIEKGDDYIMYVRFEDVPEYAKETIRKLMGKGLLKGDGNGNINLTESMVRVLVINDRAGLYN